MRLQICIGPELNSALLSRFRSHEMNMSFINAPKLERIVGVWLARATMALNPEKHSMIRFAEPAVHARITIAGEIVVAIGVE